MDRDSTRIDSSVSRRSNGEIGLRLGLDQNFLLFESLSDVVAWIHGSLDHLRRLRFRQNWCHTWEGFRGRQASGVSRAAARLRGRIEWVPLPLKEGLASDVLDTGL